jgi:hypothetical protein
MQRAYLSAWAVFEPDDELEFVADPSLDEPPPQPATAKQAVANASASGTAHRARDPRLEARRLARAWIASRGFISTVSFSTVEESSPAVVGDGS